MLKTIGYVKRATDTDRAGRVFQFLLVGFPNLLSTPLVDRVAIMTGCEFPEGISLSYTLGISFLVLVFIIIWNMAKKGIALEEAATPKIVIDDVIEIRSQDGTTQRMELKIRNSGGADLKNCLAKIESIKSPDLRLHRPRALRTFVQSEEERTGPFNLRVGESKHIPFLSYSNMFRESGAKSSIRVEYETDGPHCDLDGNERHEIVLAIYSEGPETKEAFDVYVDERGMLNFDRHSKRT